MECMVFKTEGFFILMWRVVNRKNLLDRLKASVVLNFFLEKIVHK